MASEFFSQNFRIICFTALSSIALSIWCIWADPVVNNDGVHYLRAADKILAGSWLEAVDIYSWPLYPAFISFVSRLTGTGVLTSAHILDTLLCGLLVVGFLAVVFELGGDKKTLLVAAVVILAFPTLNKYRPFVIRDLGYVACYLWSVAFLFRYWKCKQRTFLLGWFVTASIGLLFRAEGIAMLVAVPIVIFSLEGGYGRHRWWVVSLYVAGGMVLAAALTAWLYRDFAILGPAGGSGDPTELLGWAGDYLQQSVGKKLEVLQEHYAGRYYLIVYVMIIVFVTLAEIVRRLALVYALLAWWGLKQGVLFPAPTLKSLWLALIAINTLVLIGSGFFLSFVIDRYALAVSVTILLASPFVLVQLWNEWKAGTVAPRQRWLFPLVLVVCVVLGIRGLDVFTEKQFLSKAGRWVAENTEAESTLHSNNLILIYYSGKDAYHEGGGYSWRRTHYLIKNKKLSEYDYIVVVLGSDDESWIAWLDDQLHGPPVKRFSNRKGDRALIYKNRA